MEQATKLMDLQLKKPERRLQEARISKGERVGRNRFVFLYDDLSSRGVICTSTIDVRLVPPGGNRVVARFLRDTSCRRPTDHALGFRLVARFAGERVERREKYVLRSITRYIEQAQACEDLNIPDDRQDEALLFLSAGLTQAMIRPLSATLDSYATRLQAAEGSEEQIAKGAAAWRDFVDGVRSLPRFSTSYCTVLAEWSANGYTDETAPVDFTALRALSARLRADGAEVRRTGRRLRAEGIDPLTVDQFTLDNLIGRSGLSDPDPGALSPSVEPSRKLVPDAEVK